jgi:hypothetical protein
MRGIIGFRTAANVLLLLFTAAFVFQLVVLAGLIPTEMVWGGRLANEEERTVGALVSLTFLLLMILVLLLRMGRMPIMNSSRVGGRVGRYGMWVIVVLFTLNTVGNIFALDLRETLIFTPITLVSALLAWRVALGD